jgi:hypothetical protein
MFYWALTGMTTFNAGVYGSLLAPLKEFCQIRFLTLGFNVNASVSVVPHITVDAIGIGFFLRGGAKEHTLDFPDNFNIEMLFHGRRSTRGPLEYIIRTEESRFTVPDNGADHLFI